MTHWIIWLATLVYLLLGFFWMGANKELTDGIWATETQYGEEVKLVTIGFIIFTWIFWLSWQIGEYVNKKYKEWFKQ